MVRAKTLAWPGVAIAMVLIASACSSGSGDSTVDSGSPVTSTQPTSTQSADDIFGDATTTTTAAPNPCSTLPPEATDIGITADTITLLAAADVQIPIAPGLFKDAWDGVQAWADYINSHGGLACRHVEVIKFDTMLSPNESVNAQITACEKALAMVGTTSLFVFDTDPMNSCPDAAGNPIGIPDIAQITTETTHQCSPNTFPIVAPQGACPYDGGPREFIERVGEIKYFQENVDPDLRGVFLVPGDLPSIRQANITTIRAMEEAGVENVGEYTVGGSALQPVFTPFVQAIADNNANFARTGSNDQSLVKWRSEAVAQGVDAEIWECTISCYTQSIFEAGGDVVEGTYLTIFSVPFEEADTNDELQAYVDSVANPAAFGLNAWAAGVMIEDAVNAVVDRGDVNSITRESLLAELATVTAFDAHGMLGVTNPAGKVSGPCFAVIQIQDGKFVKVHPKARGVLDCDSANIHAITLDAAIESEKLG